MTHHLESIVNKRHMHTHTHIVSYFRLFVDPATKVNPRKVEGAPLRRYTDSVTVKFGRKREMDPRKRWSNLEETSEVNKNLQKSLLLLLLYRFCITKGSYTMAVSDLACFWS